MPPDSTEQPVQINVKSDKHQPQQQHHANALTHFDNSVRERLATYRLNGVEQQMSSIKHRYGQQVKHAKTDTDDRQELDEIHEPDAGRLSGSLRNRNRPTQVIDRCFTGNNLAQHFKCEH